MQATSRVGLVALTLLAFGCMQAEEDEPEEALELSESSLFVSAGEVWPKGNPTTNIAACWENPADTNLTERGWVQAAVARTWEAASSVRFTGWGKCSGSSRGVRIVIADAQPHTSGLGRDLDGEHDGMTLNFTFAKWSGSCASSAATRQRCIESIAVHEFGHALGFAHEQNRADTPSWCLTPGPQDLAFGDFDGDRRPDVFRSNGSLWFVTRDSGASWDTWNSSSYRASQLAFGDFNGDGTTDIFRTNGATWYVSWSGKSLWQAINSSGFAFSDLRFGDFDGNGTTDVFRTNGSTWYVSWSGTSLWQAINGSSIGLSELRFGDFDGDRSTDVFRTNGKTWYVSWGGRSGWQTLNTSSISLSDLRFGDFDGNGTTDVFRATGSAWQVSWSGRSAWQHLNTSVYKVQSLYFGNFYGSRQTDIYRFTSEQLQVSRGGRTQWQAWAGTSYRQGTSGDTNVGSWDASSVMNYCNPIWNNGGVLSATDSAGVRRFY